VAALLLVSILAEAYPVPIESLPAGHVSLAAVFVVGTGVIYGWAPAAIVAFTTRTALELFQRRGLLRLVYNGSVYAIAGAAAGAAVRFAPERSEVEHLLLAVVLGSAAFYVVNLILVTAVIARWARENFLPLLGATAYFTAVPFAIMASASLMLAVLWQRSPLLSAALVGPLLAIALYQRSVHRALAAVRLALTDALTGLGNQRHFHERLEQELDAARAHGKPVSLCLLDVDDLKWINDTHGHPVGDRALEAVAGCLRHGGEAFRVGGDEFALLLPDRDERECIETAQAVMARLANVEVGDGYRVSVSAGVATYPSHCAERSELYRAADQALYRSKREGKSAVHAYRTDGPTPLASAAAIA
jgi:diguanylate cyclase (GGDEF)-like protein